MAEFKRNLAVIIGINDYKNGIPSLSTPVNDATALADLLETKYEYQEIVRLFPPYKEATLENINQLLTEILPNQIRPTQDDRLLFYFAGHGIALDALENQEGPVGYLIPLDAILSDSSTYLPMQELHDALNALPCRHMLAILDCCFAGAFRWASLQREVVPKVTVYKERYDRFISDHAWQVITSAAHNQEALDFLSDLRETAKNSNHSPFALALIEGLALSLIEGLQDNKADLTGDGVITVSELYLYLRDRLIGEDGVSELRTPRLWLLPRHDNGEYFFTLPGFNPNNLPLAPALSESTNPYRGLASFEEEHSKLFFGRTKVIASLQEFVTTHPFTVVLGVSGAGKSSLVKAGLIPRLRIEQWGILPLMRPGNFPLRSLSQALAAANLPEVDLTNSIAAWAASHPESQLLLVIDQFEELFTLCHDEQEREQFFKVLAEAIANYPNQFHLVVTLRSDFEPQFLNTALRRYWTNARFLVRAMTRDELRDAIIEPIAARVMYFEPPSLVDQIIDDVADIPGVLPLLSFALSELYLKYLQSRRNNRAITQQDYEGLGGVTGLLTQTDITSSTTEETETSSSVGEKRNIYALLVGIDNYPQPLNSLKSCVNDVIYLENYLNERKTDGYQLHLQKLIDHEATHQAVIDSFQQHLCQAGSEDVALFYYGGHGSYERAPSGLQLPEQFQGQFDLLTTLVCWDSRSEGGFDLSCLELAYLITKVSEKNPHFVIILDCSHADFDTKALIQLITNGSISTTASPLNRIVNLEDLQPIPESGLFGRHILLACCQSSEIEKGYKDEHGQVHGAFTYFLINTLQRSNSNLTYKNLMRWVSALVRSKIKKQTPQVRAMYEDDLEQAFLGESISESFPYLIVSYDKEYGWVIDGGAVQGIPQPIARETTLLAIFPFDSSSEDLQYPSKSVAKAEITEVLPSLSKINFINIVENLTDDIIFKAVVASLPLPPLRIHFKEDEEGLSLARQALQTAGIGGKQPSAYICEEQDITLAQFCLLCNNRQYRITTARDNRPLVEQIDGYAEENAQKAIQRLEHIARWTTIAELSNTAITQFKADDVKMELIFDDEDLSQSKQLRLQYKYKDGEWQNPEFKLKLTNTTKKPLYCALVNLSDSFAISAPFFEAGSVRLEPGQEAWALYGEPLVLNVPDEYWSQGMTEYKDIIKLIVSNNEFDARLLTQDSLDAPRSPVSRDVDSPNQSSLERLMNRTQNRDITHENIAKYDDWYAEKVTLITVRPLDSTPVSQEQEQQLTAGVKLQPHPSLVANARLTTTPQVSRDLGNKIVPPILLEEREVVQPFQFTSGRGTDPGLSVLELTDVADHKVVTPDAPLKLLVKTSLADNEYLLPVGYDGEFFLPLGRGINTQDGTEIILERLPAPVSEGERSRQGSIRIFFEKIISQSIQREFQYPILAVAEVGDDQKVTYTSDVADVRQRIAQAKRIVLFIHDIIGNTQSIVLSLEQAKVEIDGQQQSISDFYDLVLTFDYHSQVTSISDHVRILKHQLEAVGLGENHGKELHIVAHSTGGLISRWFIEREGGNQVVQHLIMLGTPNAGLPWTTYREVRIQEWVTLALTIGLNSLSSIPWSAEVLASLMRVIERNDFALDEIKPDSDFLEVLASSDDPGISYTIIAGNSSVLPVALQQQENGSIPLERLAQRVFSFDVDCSFLFTPPNDFITTVDSIKSISQGRSPQPNFIEVACDHFTYFSSTAGLEALANALKQNYSQQPAMVKVKTRLWYFGVEVPTTNLAVGEDLTLKLNFTINSQPGGSIRVPANTLELTVYIEAPGFYLQGEHTRTLPVRDGDLMERSLTLNLTPLISGDHTISLSVYPGGRLPNLSPEKLPIKVRVNTPIVLPNIPELIDRQAIPAPEPDIILHVTLEEVLNKEQSTGLQRVGLYLTCLALECDRKPLDPLYFTANDLEILRQFVIQAAAVANGSPVDVLTSLRAIGVTLYDRLMPREHPLREHYREIFKLTNSDAPLSWLIVSEAKAVLPWELVCAYYYDPETEKNWYDEFLAQKFILAHWVGYQGLKLANEAPLLELGLTHYNQRPEHLSRWQKVLGSEAQAESNPKSGLLDLMQPSSSCYGLHVLRYTDLRQTGQITDYEANIELATGKTLNQAEELLYSQRLDFTLRRPVVGLSLVDGQMANKGMGMSGSDNQLEADWMLPLMHAGASALVGSRWSVLPESDRLFYRTFYNLIRRGTELGWAVWQARKQLRVAFPHRSDWLSYTYFGHPQCQPYLVRESQGFTFFEAINPPENNNFQAGKSYEFRASYRTEAPVWYSGRLSVQQPSAESEDLSVMVVCLTGEIPPQTHQLRPVDSGGSYQHIITITMPNEDTILPLLIRFQKGSEELNTLFLNLNEVKRGQS